MPVRNLFFFSAAVADGSWFYPWAVPRMLEHWRYPLYVRVTQREHWAQPVAAGWVILIARLTEGRTQERALQKVPRDLAPIPLFHQ